MKHRIGYNRLGRKSSHRKALIKNMVTQLYRHERIRTTKAKALEVRRRAEKLITKAKVDSVHNRRTVGKLIQDKAILAKLFTDIAPSFADRPGGYTRILKLGFRKGDAAEMVLLELVEREIDDSSSKKAEKKAVKEAKQKDAAEDAVVEDVEASDGSEPEVADSAEPEESGDASEESEDAADESDAAVESEVEGS
jgi:large subunit ribosomal protein L17